MTPNFLREGDLKVKPIREEDSLKNMELLKQQNGRTARETQGNFDTILGFANFYEITHEHALELSKLFNLKFKR